MFSWGVQWNPVSDEIIVSDYLHFKMRRYDTSGNYLGEFWRDDHVGQPYSVGVDPNDGSIYVSELKDNPLDVAIAKYDVNGNFLYSKDVALAGPVGIIRAFYTVWLTVDDNGHMWVMDSHFSNDEDNPPRMLELEWNDATEEVTILQEWPVFPESVTDSPRLYGVDITSDGVIWMSDAWNRRVYRYSTDGTLLSETAGGFLGGDERGVAINEDLGRVYIVDAENSDVDVFDLNTGNYLSSFGDEGTGPGEFTGGGRQVTVDGDGNVWVADFGGFRTLKFDAFGNPLLEAPDPSRLPPEGYLGQPRDVAVDAQSGDVWVVEAWNQRFDRFSASGQFLNTWGKRGPGGAYDMNYPRSIGIDPVTRRVWIANERGHHLQVYTYGGNYITQIGLIGSDDTDPGHFRWPVDFEFYGRRVIIGDRMGQVVKTFDADTFQEVSQFDMRNHGTAVDPDTGNIYVMRGGSTPIRVVDQDGNELFGFGERGTGPGQLQDPVDAVISNEVLYVADERNGNVQAFELDGTFRGGWGQSYGSDSYEFRNPVGLAADPQGRIYVTDSANDRIQVFNPLQPKQFEQVPPTVTMSQPAGMASLPAGNVHMAGTAQDNIAVGNVEIAIQDADTGLYWNAFDMSWQAAKVRNRAAWTAPNAPATSVQWQWEFLGGSQSGRYTVETRARDHNGNLSAPVMGSFAVGGATPPPVPPPPADDIVAPAVTVTYPSEGSSQPSAPLTIEGLATDAGGVDVVHLAIKDLESNGWWDGAGFSSSFRWWDAETDNPGGVSTGYRYDWVAGGGDYRIFVEAIDLSGNKSPKAVRNFSIAPDTELPVTTLSAPPDGATTGVGQPLYIGGAATDNLGITAVDVFIQRASDGRWYRSDFDFWSTNSSTHSEAVLVSPGEATTDWTMEFTPAIADVYTIYGVAVDPEGNVDDAPMQVVVTAIEGTDTEDPDTSLDFPADGSSVDAGLVVVSGTASDDTGVAGVDLTIVDDATGFYWDGTGFDPVTSVVSASLTAPLGLNTDWSYDFAAPAGDYTVTAGARDAFGNADASPSIIGFTADPVADAIAPETTIGSPGNGASLLFGNVTITGNATDNVGVAGVDVEIHNTTTNQYWNGFTWQAPQTIVAGAVTNPGATSAGWSYDWDADLAGSVTITARASDAIPNVDPSPAQITVEVSAVADTTPPNATASVPAVNGEVLTEAQPTLEGSATDNVGVGQVLVAIRNNATNQWWNGTGWGGWTTHQATLTNPGGTSTDWSYAFNGPGDGQYALWVRADDTSGNQDPTKVWRPFSISSGGGGTDVEDPNATVTTPTNNQSFPSTTVNMSGTATDDVGVAKVDIAIRNTATNQWWTGTGWGGWTVFETTLTNPDEASTGWSYSWTAPGSGNYALWVRAQDTAGKQDPTKPWVPFSVN